MSNEADTPAEAPEVDPVVADRLEDRNTALSRLLTGRGSIDFIGRSRLWLYITLAVLALAVIVPLTRGLNFSIEFTGGSSFIEEGATRDFTAGDLEAALTDLGVAGALVQVVNEGEGAQISTPAISEISGVDDLEVAAAIEEVTGGEVSVSTIGPRWGQAVTEQAVRALIVFLVLVIAYLTVRFEWRMAAAAVATLVHDVGITVAVYALLGFSVSPSTVIALLTILGYSLYDTVVVFDRVTEDAAKLTSVSTTSYGQVANQALNNVLIRSISTSLTSVLPVASLLFIGANVFGATTLTDLALALFIGMTVGTYSSIIVATPFLVWLKEKDPKYAELKERAALGS
ncbi:MAG TPA: protein translocase subunit SecF [Euzebya sp.]|nr:protein translocase subunit SecF [Euzebya sp.]